MGVHWTVPYVLHSTEGRDRQWDLRGKQGTYGCPLDCPLCPIHGTGERDRQLNLKGEEGTYGCPLDCPLCPIHGTEGRDRQ